MKAEIGDNNCLFVFLEPTDVAHYGLHQVLDSSDNRRIGQIMNRIFAHAGSLMHFVPPRTKSRRMELLPFEDGSMLICFMFENKRLKIRAKRKNVNSQKVFEFGAKEDLHRYLRLAALSPSLQCRLFESDGTYRLISDAFTESLKRLLSEFSQCVNDPLAAAQTKEFWREVSFELKKNESIR